MELKRTDLTESKNDFKGIIRIHEFVFKKINNTFLLSIVEITSA